MIWKEIQAFKTDRWVTTSADNVCYRCNSLNSNYQIAETSEWFFFFAGIEVWV
jgi:hypothetical protein